MISMYSSLYWNTGGANQAIFESSQGRFAGGYWDNPEVEREVRNMHRAMNRYVDRPQDWTPGS